MLIILFSALPFFFPFFVGHGQVDQSTFQEEIAQLEIKEQSGEKDHQKKFHEESSAQYRSHENANSLSVELFYFDPNTLSVDGWKKLGIREKTALTIQKYISKGGKFYKPEDIGKIWGLNEDDLKRVLPYVRIAKQDDKLIASPPTSEKRNFEKPKYEMQVVDVNAADTTAFIALPGIGSKLAARIVAFREKLGGFYKIEQVGETFGLADSVFQKIKHKLAVGSATVKKLNINTDPLDQLKLHPYLRYNLANAIVQYRQQHGNFRTLSDLKNIMAISPEIYTKVLPYLDL